MIHPNPHRSPRFLQLVSRKPLIIILWVSTIGILTTACNLPVGSSGQSLDATKAALDVQATIQAQQVQQGIQATSDSAAATRIAQEVQATLLVQQSTQLAEQAAQQVDQSLSPTQAPPTEPPLPTDTPPAVTPTQPPPTDIPPTPTPDIEAMMKEAKILLFEDMAGLYEVRYIKNALDIMGLRYVDVGDASGNFKNQILSGTDWDLIIVGAESRNKIQGEFYVYLNDELTKGTAVIIETWALDDIASGKISNILTRCGIEYQKDWIDPESPSLWYLDPEHQVFHEPNEGMSLTRFVEYWSGDEGDLIKLTPGGNATLLVGNIATEKYRYGTVAACQDGRLIIQTHSSHNYRQDDMVRLWQNYIYYTLKNHILTTDQ